MRGGHPSPGLVLRFHAATIVIMHNGFEHVPYYKHRSFVKGVRKVDSGKKASDSTLSRGRPIEIQNPVMFVAGPSSNVCVLGVIISGRDFV